MRSEYRGVRLLAPSGGLAQRGRLRAGACHAGFWLLLALNATLPMAVAGSPPIVGWGHNYYGQATPPAEATNIVAVSAGWQHALALQADGTLLAWGWTNNGLVQVPPAATNVVAMAAGVNHNLAMRADGVVLAWGNNDSGQTNVPANASNVVALAAGDQHSVALRADGTIIAWGDNTLDQLNVPAAATNVVAIAAGLDYTLALKADGSLAAWGWLTEGDIVVPASATNVVAIAAGMLDCLLLRSDGTLVAWGRNFFGESDIPTNAVNVTAIAAGELFSLAALQDGTVIGWGDNYYGESAPPASVTSPLAIYAGDDFSLAWLRDPSADVSPRFWRQPPDRIVSGGDTLFLHPGINGTLPLHFQWFFNNAPMPGQTNRWLALPNANPTQMGGYSVVVTNDFGAVTSAVATVTVPAIVITSQPNDVTAMMNTNVILAATVAGTAPLSYRWQKNGQDLSDTNRTSDSASPTLAIANIIPSDAGNYRLVVSNAYTAVTSDVAVLTVLFPQPLLNVDFGGSAQSAKTGLAAMGQADADYWNAYAAGSPSVTNLLLADGSPTGVGVVVSNAPYSQINTWTDPMLHDFVYAPDFGGLFSVRFFGLPPGTYDFYLYTGGAAYWPWLGSDFELVVGGVSQGHNVIYGFGADAPPWQEGLHYATYHNIQVSAPGQSVVLLVRGNSGEEPNLAGVQIGQFPTSAATPVFWSQPTSQFVPIGSDFILKATGAGHPTPAQQWFFNGAPVANAARITGTDTNTLAIAGAQFSDTGDYFAVITNSFGAATSAVAHVVIGVPPTLTLQASNQTWIAGATYSLATQATGTAPLGYQWYFGSTPLTNSAHLSGTASDTLTISNVLTSDAGTYELVVTGLFGSITNTAVVAVVVPPAITSQPAGYSVPVGMPVTLSASLSGTAPFNYQWRLNGTDIPGATSNALSYAALDPANYGDYQLVASNFGGAVISTVAQLTVGPVAAWGNGNARNYSLPPWPGPGLSNVVAVAAGPSLNLALRAEGTLYAWSAGSGLSVPPGPPAGLNGVVGIGVGASHGLAIRSDGTVVAWGSNTYGQTNVPAGLSNVVAVAGGNYHSVALRADGTVVAWGGTTSGGESNVPPGLTKVVAIDANGSQNLALRENGTVVGWGGGSSPQLVPPYLHGAAGISVGYISSFYSLALLSSGSAAVWNALGLTNTPADLTNLVAVEAAGARGQDQAMSGVCLGLRSDGTVAAWGGSTAQLVLVPPGLSNAVALAGASSYALALVKDGRPLIVRSPIGGTFYSGADLALKAQAVGNAPLAAQWCKDGNPVPGATNQVLVVPSAQLTDAGSYQLVVTNALGVAQSLAVPVTIVDQAPGFVSQPATGFAYYGSPFSVSASVIGSGPMQLTWLRNGTPIATGADELSVSRALPQHGGAYQLIASNPFGAVTSAVAQITFSRVAAWGNSLTGLSNAPVDPGSVLGVASGYYHALAIRADHTVAAWGSGTATTNVPADLADVVAVAGGNNFSLALRSDGTVTNWGPNLPLQTSVLASLTNVVALSAGQYHALALRADGTVTAWGNNGSGQTTVPAGLSNVVAVAAGSVHSLALKDDGTVVAWGAYGKMPSYTNAVAISAGYSQSTILQADGTLVNWTTTGGATWLPAGLTNLVASSSGGASDTMNSLAMRADGTLLAWGGDLGNPFMIPADLQSATAISAGGRGTLALLNDRSPAFTVQPWDRRVASGTNVTLRALAVGQPPVRFQWYCNGQLLPGATSNYLTLSNTQPSQSGAYQLVAFNDLGTTASGVANLTIAVPAVRLAVLGVTANGFRFSFTSLPRVLYIVEFKPNLAASVWTELERRFGIGDLEIVTDTSANGAARFYRVRALYAPPSP